MERVYFGWIEKSSEEWFRPIDLWVMSPARFHCATSLKVLFFSVFYMDTAAL